MKRNSRRSCFLISRYVASFRTVFMFIIGIFGGLMLTNLLSENNSCLQKNPHSRIHYKSLDNGNGESKEKVKDGMKSVKYHPDKLQLFNCRTNKLISPYHDNSKKENLVYVGVMTAKKYLSTRALAVHRTWAKTIKGKVTFFSSADSYVAENLSVVNLPGVDDTYPPQKKSFLMLKYMHDNYLNTYEWFVRCDDDVFIHGDRLSNFLHSINSSKTWYIGQAGQGQHSQKSVVIGDHENFCMGGPAVIFSRETLVRIVPHISYCLKHLYTKHEDVEIGRCVRMFAGIQCTWAFEMQNLFYHNREEKNGSYTRAGKLHEMYQSISLHPVKDSRHLYRIYNHFRSVTNEHSRKKLRIMSRDKEIMDILLDDRSVSDLNSIRSHTGQKFKPRNMDEVLTWDFIQKYFYSITDLNPKRGLDKASHSALHKAIIEVMRLINGNTRQKGRTIEFKHLLYGYRRIDPVNGVDYIMDMLLLYKKQRGKRRKLTVRRHSYFHQGFDDFEVALDGNSVNLEAFAKSSSSYIEQEYPSNQLSISSLLKTVHFILPIAGRATIFHRFISNFEEVCLRENEAVSLLIVLFKDPVGSLSSPIELKSSVRSLKSNYPDAVINIIEPSGKFSRALSLHIGSKQHKDTDLLFFIDVDIHLSRGVLSRIRRHTIINKQIYYPIVFSQYDRSVLCEFHTCTKNNHFIFSEWNGYWRSFGFGIAGIYKTDLEAIGGFNTSIVGWGAEDVDLYDRAIQSRFRVFRAPDPGMVHVFHPIFCNKNLPSEQYEMCIGSKASSLASESDLVRLLEKLRKSQKST